jgi:hypothetical protein
MAAKKQNPLQAYPGKIFFGVALFLCFVLSIMLVAQESDPKADIDAVTALSGKLKKKLRSRRVLDPPPAVPAAEDVRQSWETPLPLAPLRPWSFHREPKVRIEVERKEDPRKVLLPPVRTKIDQKDYSVTIAWKNADGTTAKIKGYNVFRWVGDAKPPKKPLNDRPVPLETPTFTDSDYDVLKPFAKVNYAVAAITDEETRTEKKVSELSAPITLELPDDRKITFHGKKGVEFAFIRVSRFLDGKYVPKDFMTYLGDPIGKEERIQHEGQKIVIDFSTDYILAFVGKEIVKETRTREDQMRDEKGKLLFGPNGAPLMEKKTSVVKKELCYVLISDNAGEVTRIDETEGMKIDPPPPPPPPPGSSKLDFKIHELQLRLHKANKSKAPWVLRRRLGKRIEFLKKNRSKILMPRSKEVDEKRLFAEGGILYEYRWTYLLANRKYQDSNNNQKLFEKALLLREHIQDVESLLSEEGLEKEKKEWEYDREDFEKKFRKDSKKDSKEKKKKKK